MKQILVPVLSVMFLVSSALFAQTTTKSDKGEKGEKGDKGEKVEKKEITIQKKEGTKNETMKIVIDGDNVTINGKPADQYKGDDKIVIDEDIIINGNHVVIPGQKGTVRITGTGSTRPLLGVTTEKDAKGVKINSISDNSGAEKAGLKQGDIITMINKTAVSSPEGLTEAIRQQKPGDIVEVSYVRAGKPLKVKATLGKTTETYSFNTDEFNYNFEQGHPYAFTMPRKSVSPRAPYRVELDGIQIYGSSTPKYGMSIQDDEDRRGVKVTDVDDEGNAWKGGLREDDIITEIDNEPITGVDNLKEKLTARKDNPTVSLKVLRDGKTATLTIKVPRKLKSASL